MAPWPLKAPLLSISGRQVKVSTTEKFLLQMYLCTYDCL